MDECAGCRASGNGGVDVDDTGAFRLEPDGDLDGRILELNFPLAIKGYRAGTRAQCDTVARFHTLRFRNGNVSDESWRNGNSRAALSRLVIARRNPTA